MRRVLPAVAALLLTLGTLTACGDEEKGPAGTDLDPKVIDVTFEGGTVDPSGERVKVALDQPIELVVTADEPGEIHVHTKPDEQTFEYVAGTTTLPFSVDKPGLVEVESHDLEEIIVQLEVE